MVSKDKYQLAW